MRKLHWVVILALALPFVLLWLLPREDADRGSQPLAQGEDRKEAGESDPAPPAAALSASRSQPEAPRALPAPAGDPELARRLGRDGVVEARVLDRSGQPLSGQPVLVLPAASYTTQMSMNPAHIPRLMEIARESPDPQHPLSGVDGGARVGFLPRNEDLVLISGSGDWLLGSSARVRSGTREEPARVELRLHRRAALEVRARDAQGQYLKVLQARFVPDPETGVEAQLVRRQPSQASTRIRCESLPAEASCRVEADVFAAQRSLQLQGEITLAPGEHNLLVLEMGN